MKLNGISKKFARPVSGLFLAALLFAWIPGYAVADPDDVAEESAEPGEEFELAPLNLENASIYGMLEEARQARNEFYGRKLQKLNGEIDALKRTESLTPAQRQRLERKQREADLLRTGRNNGPITSKTPKDDIVNLLDHIIRFRVTKKMMRNYDLNPEFRFADKLRNSFKDAGIAMLMRAFQETLQGLPERVKLANAGVQGEIFIAYRESYSGQREDAVHQNQFELFLKSSDAAELGSFSDRKKVAKAMRKIVGTYIERNRYRKNVLKTFFELTVAGGALCGLVTAVYGLTHRPEVTIDRKVIEDASRKVEVMKNLADPPPELINPGEAEELGREFLREVQIRQAELRR